MSRNSDEAKTKTCPGGKFTDLRDSLLPMFFHAEQPTRWRVTFGLEPAKSPRKIRRGGSYISDHAMPKSSSDS